MVLNMVEIELTAERLDEQDNTLNVEMRITKFGL